MPDYESQVAQLRAAFKAINPLALNAPFDLTLLKDFARDYLRPTYTEQEESTARSCIKQFESLKQTICSANEHIEALEEKIASLKQPLLFGKKEYQNKVNKMNEKLSENKNIKENAFGLIAVEEKECHSAIEILGVIENEKIAIKRQYQFEGKKFNSIKSSLIEDLHDRLVIKKLPHYSLKWHKISNRVKMILRLNPILRIYPLIGWHKARPLIELLNMFKSDWSQTQEIIFIEGEPESLCDVLKRFLLVYADNDKDDDSMQCCYLRASALWTYFTIENELIAKANEYILAYQLECIEDEGRKNDIELERIFNQTLYESDDISNSEIFGHINRKLFFRAHTETTGWADTLKKLFAIQKKYLNLFNSQVEQGKKMSIEAKNETIFNKLEAMKRDTDNRLLETMKLLKYL